MVAKKRVELHMKFGEDVSMFCLSGGLCWAMREEDLNGPDGLRDFIFKEIFSRQIRSS